MALFGLFRKKSSEPEISSARTYEPLPTAFTQDAADAPQVNQELNPFMQPTAFRQSYNKDTDLVISKLELISARLENIGRRLEIIERYLMQQNQPQNPPPAMPVQRRW